MRNLLLLLLVVTVQQSTIFAQFNKKSDFRYSHFRDSNSTRDPSSLLDIFMHLKKAGEISKGNSTTQYWPDTIIVYSKQDTIRSYYTFDLNGNVLSEYAWKWVNKTWVNHYKSTIISGPNDNPMIWIYADWINNEWVIKLKGTSTFDSNGNMINGTMLEWKNNTWENFLRYTYTYDFFDKMVSEIREYWINNAWVIDGKTSYTYDSNGNILSEILESYTNNLWVNDEKTSYTYDSNGKIVSELTENYWTNAWVNSMIATYTYNSSGNLIVILRKWWNNNAWENSYRQTYSYDSNGYRILCITEEWIDNIWVNSYRENYTNDSNGNVMIWEFFKWNNTTSKWEQTETEPYQMILNGVEFWTNSGIKIQIHWISGVATKINHSIEYSNISLFPNPASTILNISGIDNRSIGTVYSIDGKQMRTDIFTDINHTLDVSQMNFGIYILKIKTAQGIVMLKFIKK